MTVEDATDYFLCMDVLKARETLDLNMSTSWPHISNQNDKKQRHRSLVKAACLENKLVIGSASDLKRILGNG